MQPYVVQALGLCHRILLLAGVRSPCGSNTTTCVLWFAGTVREQKPFFPEWRRFGLGGGVRGERRVSDVAGTDSATGIGGEAICWQGP